MHNEDLNLYLQLLEKQSLYLSSCLFTAHNPDSLNTKVSTMLNHNENVNFKSLT